MTMKKILAATLAAVMALSLAACGGKKDEEPTVTEATSAYVQDAETTAAEETAAESTEAATEAATEAKTEAATEAAATTEAATEAEEATEAGKKTPETKEEIVEFYKKAAAETDKGKITTQSKMELDSLDGGSGLVGKLISAIKPIAKNALAKNSTPSDHITGGYENLTADDVASATAKDDGKYTTLTINLKDQTDGFKADPHAGHVGHGISVLGDVQKAIDELDGVEVDPSEGTVSLLYNNAKINVKIDNATGKIVSGTWSDKVNVSIDNVKAKVSIISATLDGTKAVISQTITL